MPYQDIALPTELNSMVSMFHIVIFNNYENYPKEEVGFEPTRRFTDLTVFITVPLSLTWVFFHKTAHPTN